MKELAKEYDHKSAEKKWQEYWEREGTYRWQGQLAVGSGQWAEENAANCKRQTANFVIDTPPPTVSGLLHMGHIFSYAQADFIARYQRMKGKDVFYPMGFDDNGLPTERLVEKVKGVRANQMPREDFVKLCREVVQEAEDEFRKLFKSAALSVDWTQEYQTISSESRKLSQMSFLDLYKKGHIYRAFRPGYWDWVDQTAIAQAEVENKEMPGVMNEIEFEIESSVVSGQSSDKLATDDRRLTTKITIATTRPELLGACVAVMYHPEDPNATKYAGKFAVTPLFGVKVPMIADELVEKDKGTGIVMCCTFGDDTDKEWWRKYNLPLRSILTKEGKMNLRVEWLESSEESSTLDSRLSTLQDLKPKQAQAKILELLKAEGKLLKQTPITHTVKCAECSGTPIEIIPTHQWFVRIMDKKEELKAKARECNWHPEYMRLRVEQWIDGLKEDWCISRQRYFGVPIPVWYGKSGEEIIADIRQLPVDPLVDKPLGVTEFTPDRDVLDTWATSSISPQLSSKAITKEYAIDYARHQQLFPADLRPQAHEIIRTWAFYTIVKAYLHENTIPWKNLMISGWCLAADKTKMSKSKGNVVTPVALIEEKGTDSVRYWASTSRLGADTAFSEDLLKIGRKLVNKLWNAAKFASVHVADLQNHEKTAADECKNGTITEPLDLWILTRLHRAIDKATKEFERFEYCDARVAIEDFFWNDFCDNYLEMVKGRAYGGELAVSSWQLTESTLQTTNCKLQTVSAHHTIYHCLKTILQLFAPFVPHITEELYSHIFAGKGSIHAKGNWPLAQDFPVYAAEEKAGFDAVMILAEVRKLKAEQKISLKTPIEELTVNITAESSLPLLKKMEADLKNVTGSAKIIWQENADVLSLQAKI